jgi:hypothetical protein
MMCGGKMAVFYVLIGSLLVVATKPVTTNASENPYAGITDRNVFDLKPPLAPVRPEDLKTPPPDLKLTGITSILGMKQALLKALTPARPPQQAKEEFYILTENQSEGDVEVIAIDEKAGTVKVNNHGTPQTLDFVNNGVKLPNASALPVPPGPGQAPTPIMGLQSSLQSGAPGRGMGMRQIPTRPVRMSTTSGDNQGTGAYGQNPGQNSMAGGAQGSMGGMAQGIGGLSSGMGTGATIANQSTPGFVQAPNYGISGDQQAILIEAHRAQLQEQGDTAGANMLPPTDFTPPTGQSLLPQ